MNVPIPSHLQPILKPAGDGNSEFQVTGEIQCQCGCKQFEILFVGDDSQFESDRTIDVKEIGDDFFLIVYVKCADCNKELLLFDNDYHGWNGFVCGGDNRSVDRPKLQKWQCDRCSNSENKVSVIISSQGKDDFMEEGGAEFGEENWVEGFEYITIETECCNCTEKHEEWISYETM